MRFAKVLLLTIGCALAVPTALPQATAVAAPATRTGKIAGVVRDRSGKAVENALVILECSCLQRTVQARTNANGLYVFTKLPPGVYTVQVVHKESRVNKVIKLERGMYSALRFTVGNEEFKRLIREAPKSVSRDFTQLVESASTTAALHVQTEPSNREGYAHIRDNAFRTVKDHPLSTFSADVDTASYANVRRFVSQGKRPPKDAVRVEELINYFHYDYVAPKDSRPVAVNWEIGACPWAPKHVMARIGLQTKPIRNADVPARNLVFLIDVSGSMNSALKLPLLKRALHLLVDQLRRKDTVSIVVYAGAAGLVLPPTRGDQGDTIRRAIDELEPGGSTNGAGGIRLAYAQARKAFIPKGVNRVILATDGDFNVGVSSEGELTRLIEQKRETNVFLSVLGFGMGNLQDERLELLADKGNGNYAYIDSVHEARKVLVEESGATLFTVAKDVKLQVEFNPAKVAEYRLIGYENRLLANEDFADDRKDAGDMGAGHSVTALYELVPRTVDGAGRRRVAKLKYQSERVRTQAAASGDWMTVKVRFKRRDKSKSRKMEVVIKGRPKQLAQTRDDFRWAAAVASYGMVLRDSKHRGNATLKSARKLATSAVGRDPGGHRAAFLELLDATPKR